MVVRYGLASTALTRRDAHFFLKKGFREQVWPTWNLKRAEEAIMPFIWSTEPDGRLSGFELVSITGVTGVTDSP